MVEAEIIEDYEGSGDGPLSDILPEGTREALSDLDQRIRLVVAEYPLAAVLGAVATGYLVGRILR